MKLAGLYAITPDASDSQMLIERVRAAMHGTAPRGWAALQYRNKLAGAGQRAAEARALAALCAGYGVPFIVNDDVELALAAGAAGAHLGSNDGDLSQARARLGSRVLGTEHIYLQVAAPVPQIPTELEKIQGVLAVHPQHPSGIS